MSDPRGQLIFHRPHTGAGELLFGDDAGGGGQPPGDAPGARIAADAGIAGDLATSAALAYDINVNRGPLAAVRSAAQPARPIGRAARAAWQPSASLGTAHRAAAQPGRPIGHAARAWWQDTRALHAAARLAMEQGRPTGHAARGHWQRTITLAAGARAHVQPGQPLLHMRRALYQENIRLLALAARLAAQPGRPLANHWARNFANAQPLAPGQRLRAQPARLPPYHWHPPPPWEPDGQLCYCPDTLGQLVFERPYTGAGELLFVCRPCPGTTPPDPEIPDGGVIVRPRRSYIVINRIEIRRVDDGTLLPAEAFSMQLDYQSWTWSFSAAFSWHVRDALMPDSSGPVALEVRINNVPYRLLAEKITRSVRFPTRLVNVQGRGHAAVLDTPYAAHQSWANDAQITAQQLMADVLTFGGVGIGWSVDFGLTDWIIPPGAWAHQGSYISALADIAQAVGGTLQPHPTEQRLIAAPAWPLPWWRWAAEAEPDYVLPNGLAELEETTWDERPDANQIFIEGMAGGILADVKRQGSAGDAPLPAVVHALITDAAAARQRGQHELAQTGTAIRQRLTLPVLPETGIIAPGRFVKYSDGHTSRLGISRAVSVDWSFPALTQTLEIEGHE